MNTDAAKINLPVFLFVSIFSIASWADVIGIWSELPVMVNLLPERWKLPSRMSLALQCANIAPFLYSVVSKINSRRNKTMANRIQDRTDVILSFVIIAFEIVSMFLISFFWDYKISFGGEDHSIALLLLVCCSGLCSCLSTLVFLPYLARYPAQYISAYYLGNGIGGIIPGLIGLSQGLGGEPACVNITVNKSCSAIQCETEIKIVPEYPSLNFSVQIYFLLICFLLVASLISFYCLNYTSLVKHQSPTTVNGQVDQINATKKSENLIKNGLNQDVASENVIDRPHHEVYSSFELAYLLILTWMTSAIYFGVHSSLLPYSCLSYGNMTYNLSVRLSHIITSIVSILYLFLPRPNSKIISGIVFISLLGCVYQIVLSLQSPHPFLKHETAGSVLAVLSTVVVAGCFTYVRIALTSKLHSYDGRRALFWCGAITQIGCFCGTMTMFVLINWTSLFVSQTPCSDWLT